METVDIIDYTPQYNEDFKNINLEWIAHYFKVEAHDVEQLEHAQEHILDLGGHIFLARWRGEIVGTVAIVPNGAEEVELIKMGVRPKAQGHQIGEKLARHALECARQKGFKRVFLETNSALKPAITLYEKVGFRKVDLRPSPYQRADYQMLLTF